MCPGNAIIVLVNAVAEGGDFGVIHVAFDVGEDFSKVVDVVGGWVDRPFRFVFDGADGWC